MLLLLLLLLHQCKLLKLTTADTHICTISISQADSTDQTSAIIKTRVSQDVYWTISIAMLPKVTADKI